MNRLNKTESAVFLKSRFSQFLKDPFSILLREFFFNFSDLPHYVLRVIVYQQNPLVTMTLVFSIDLTLVPLLEELAGVVLDHASKMPRLMLRQQTLTELYHS